jgi:predicted RecB family endonuclease
MHARIVIELAPGLAARGSLEAAAAFADRLGAELVGLFIEDPDLLRFAALPFAHEIGHASAERRRTDVPAIERSLRVHAAEAERSLASAAERSAVRWSFRVARGIAATELLAAALGAAAEVATTEVRLLLLGDGESPATRWAEAARDRLGGGLVGGEEAMRVSLVHAADLAQLASALQHDLPGVVVLLGDEAVLSRRDLQALLRETTARVLILSGPAAAGRR